MLLKEDETQTPTAASDAQHGLLNEDTEGPIADPGAQQTSATSRDSATIFTVVMATTSAHLVMYL